MRFPHLAQRLFNRPLAILPDKAEVIMAALADRLGVAHLFRQSGEAVSLAPMAFDDDGSSSPSLYTERGYDIVNGIAIVPIHGTLVQKTGTLRPYSGMTGYDGIRQNFLTALTDDNVEAIILDVDSPGGEVAGCFDLVDEIFHARGEKQIWAILNEDAYSAAYAIASAADYITVPRTGGTGSVGVISMHVDWSKALSASGVKVTFIQFGAHKSEGAAELPLSPEALERFQKDIDASGELFVATVARNRGLSVDAVRGTEALTYQGEAGVAVGFADAVMAPAAAYRALLDKLG